MKRKEVSLKDAVISGAIVQEAIINLLEERMIATREDVMEEVKRIRGQMEKDEDGVEVDEKPEGEI